MKYYSLKYTKSDNIGDEIQSLAVEQYLPRIDGFIDRDLELDNINERIFLIMNGWFKHGANHWRDGATENWPPSDNITPCFLGLHIAYPELLTESFIEYCRKWAPIGCRDKGTMQMLHKKGIDAFFSRCLTLTFPKREKIPKNGKIFIVEGKQKIDKSIIPPELLNEAEYRNHYVHNKYKKNNEFKRSLAKQFLDDYKFNAKLVITNLLHCTMPCLAMNIPVIFITNDSPFDYRLDPVRDLITIYEPKDKINWEPKVPDISSIKESLKNRVENFIVQT